jgi:hypothetical protein
MPLPCALVKAALIAKAAERHPVGDTMNTLQHRKSH